MSEVVGLIRDVEYGQKRIWGKVVYNLSYDFDTKIYFCECDGFTYKKPCKHIEEFKKMVEGMLRDNQT